MEIRTDDVAGGAFGGGVHHHTATSTSSLSSSRSSSSPTTAAVVAGHAAPNMGPGGNGTAAVNGRRKMPMFVLSSAEKRKSPVI
ncbi:hypothetical protein EMCG_08764 [[Emmonsia] crescens]|uniref:Uncharacterized protein n=1 Tax=[Emmonsia] crescens TaxID=73230 RepID=A0A0G2I5B3_9EURO|nr:hypothetical protein EMCG_08764 [Emmonsia crescens UAMH 3008]